MLHENVIRPPNLAGNADQKAAQTQKYLYRLAEQLQNIFDSIEDSKDYAKQLEMYAAALGKIERAMKTKAGRSALSDAVDEIDKELANNREAISVVGDRINVVAGELNVVADRLEVEAGKIQLNADQIAANANEISLAAKDILTLRAGVDDNAAAIILANGRIDANANEISLAAKDIITLQAGVDDNAASIVLTNDAIAAQAKEISANADAIKLKADQASLDIANGRIDAQANTIALKADKIDLEGYVTATELETVRASISNLTSGLTTAMIINANTVNVDQINGTFGSFDALNHNGALVSQRSITMGSVSSTGKALSTGGELDLQHSHAVTVNDDGTITLGEVSAEGGNFNIADTKVYKDGVSAAKESVTLSAPKGWNGGSYVVEASNGKTHTVRLPEFSSSGGTSFNSSHKTTVYFHTASVSGPLKSVEVDATSVYNSGKTAGANGVTVYSPAVTDTEHPGGSSKLMRVYMQAKASNGAASPVAHELIDASPVYDVGYKAGWAAAVAKLGISGNIIKGPSSTVGEQADLYTVTAGGSLNNITSTAANYFNVNGYAYAYINGTNVASQYIYKANQINVGQ